MQCNARVAERQLHAACRWLSSFSASAMGSSAVGLIFIFVSSGVACRLRASRHATHRTPTTLPRTLSNSGAFYFPFLSECSCPSSASPPVRLPCLSRLGKPPLALSAICLFSTFLQSRFPELQVKHEERFLIGSVSNQCMTSHFCGHR